MFGKKKKIVPEILITEEDNVTEFTQEIPSLETEETTRIALSPLEKMGTPSRKLPKIIRKEKQRDSKKGKSDFTPDGHAIDAFMQENRHAEILLKETRKVIRKIEKSNLEMQWKDLQLLITELKEIKFHYQRKEELLLPRLQRNNLNFSIENFINSHKEIKKNIQNLLQAIKNRNISNAKQLYIQTSETIHKNIAIEEQILFPTALSQLKEEEWREIRSQGKTIGYSWIEKKRDPIATHLENERMRLDGFRLESGFMSINKIDQTLNSLPLEITVVNEEEQIIFYNNESNRIFKRLPNFIGEKYTDCHVGRNKKSVKKIIEDFKKSKKEMVELYFNIDSQKIYVQYKPLFTKNGDYHGFIEIAMDITYFRQLEGEKIDIE